MNLTIQELNEIYYSLGVSVYKGMFVDQKVNETATEKIFAELKRLNEEGEKPKSSQPKVEAVKEIKEVKQEVKVIEPISDTGSEVADFLIAVAAQLPEPSGEIEESTEEVMETVKKAKFPGAKKSNLMDSEK